MFRVEPEETPQARIIELLLLRFQDTVDVNVKALKGSTALVEAAKVGLLR